jgi:hypothetical protein
MPFDFPEPHAPPVRLVALLDADTINADRWRSCRSRIRRPAARALKSEVTSIDRWPVERSGEEFVSERSGDFRIMLIRWRVRPRYVDDTD